MFKFRLALFLALLLASASPVLADNISHSEFTDSFEIGVEGEKYSYREPLFAKLDGYGFGINGTYQFNIDHSYFFRANVLADFLNVDYSSDGTGSFNGQTDYEQDYRGMFGYNFKLGGNSGYLAPYFGVGFRVLFDAGATDVTTTGAVGYDRRSEYLYLPIGASYSFKAGNWRLKPTAEYDLFIEGYQTTYLRDLGADNNLENHQGGGFGVRADFMVAPPVDFYNFSFGPYFRYWNIAESDVQPIYFGGVEGGAGLEPKNNTFEAGIRTSIKFN